MPDFLKGVRVLDLSRYLPGPYATHVLAEMGAEVINIEEPGTGNPMRILPPLVDGTSWAFQALYAGKKSVTLDLKAPESREIVRRLASTSHVLMESFRPGVARRLGVDYESIRPARPDIVYCSLTSYGQTGPYRDRPGHDLNFVGLAGLLEVGPLPGITVSDLCGGLLAATTIIGALRSGRGAHLDLSLTDAMLSWMQLQAAQVFATGENPGPSTTFLNGTFACYHVYTASDGRRLSVAALEPKFWQELCDTLGRPDLVPLQFSSDDQPQAVAALEAIFRTRARDEWVEGLAGLPVAPVLALSEAVNHPQFRERGMVEPFASEAGTTVRRVAFPARVARSSAPSKRAPALGEHTEEILSELRSRADGG